MTRRTRRASWLALCIVFLMIVAACGGGGREDSGGGGGGGGGDGEGLIDTSNCPDNSTQGVEEDKITLGTSLPQSGLYAAFAEILKGYQAYFDFLNESEGGVNGREVEIIAEDDGYESGQTVQNINTLLQREQVFGTFNVVGTPNNLAIRDQLNQDCVPQLYNATGSALWGNPEEYPWTIGSIPTYATETGVFVDYLERENPDARVAVLYQNDDFGKEYLEALQTLTEGTDIEIVAEETYETTDPDVDSQITSIANSDADTVLLAVTALKCPQSLDALQGQSGFDPEVVWMSQTCTSATVIGLAAPGAADGVLSAVYLKDPVDPQWDDDEAMTEFREEGGNHGLSEEDTQNGLVGYGWTMGALLAETIRAAGDDVNRVSVMEAARSLDQLEVGLLLPGVTISTDGNDDPFPIETMTVGQYNGEFFEFVGDPVSFEGESAEFTPELG